MMTFEQLQIRLDQALNFWIKLLEDKHAYIQAVVMMEEEIGFFLKNPPMMYVLREAKVAEHEFLVRFREEIEEKLRYIGAEIDNIYRELQATK